MITLTRTKAIWLLVGIIVIGIGIRSYHITARSLWFDEAFSWRLVNFSWTELIARDIQDVHPPLYYLALKIWTIVFGSSLLSLRSFSVFCGALTVAATYLFTAAGTHRRSLGLVAAALIALSGFQIQFSWEARMYTLGTVLLVLSSWVLLLATRRSLPRPIIPTTESTLLWWLAYGVLAAAFAYTHYYAVFSLAAHALFVAGVLVWTTRGRIGEMLQSRLLWQGIFAALVATALYSPWIPTAIAQNQQVQASFWIPPIGGWSIPDTFYRIYFPTTGIPPHETIVGMITTSMPMVVTIIMWIALAITGYRSGITQKLADWLVLLLGVTPFVLSITLSFIGRSLYQDRFFVFAHIFILVGFVMVVARLPLQKTRRVLLTLLLIISAVAYAAYWRELAILQKPGAHAATQVIFAERVGNEPIIVSSPFVYFAVLHYATEEYDEPQAVRLYSETNELVHFAGGPILKEDDFVGPAIFDTTETIWIVDTTGFGGQPLQLPAGWQAERSQTFPEVFMHQGDVTVTKYHYVRQ